MLLLQWVVLSVLTISDVVSDHTTTANSSHLSERNLYETQRLDYLTELVTVLLNKFDQQQQQQTQSQQCCLVVSQLIEKELQQLYIIPDLNQTSNNSRQVSDYLSRMFRHQNHALGRLDKKLNKQNTMIERLREATEQFSRRLGMQHFSRSRTDQDKKVKGQVLRPSLTHVILGNDPVTAMTSFENQLFVARGDDDHIAVYDTSTFELIRQLKVVGMGRWLYGMAPCPTDNCLYVSDWTNHAILQVNLSIPASSNAAAAAATRWPVPSAPLGLSVNSEHHVMVTSWSPNKIREYTPNGSVRREISDKSYIWHAIEQTNETLAVSRSGSVHGVCLLSVDGRILHSYGNSTPGSGPGQMNNPRGLATDEQGYLLVADQHNDRIVILSPRLSEARLLKLPMTSAGQISKPRAIWLDRSRGRLYVGESASPHRVLVFDKVSKLSDAFSP